MLEGPQNHPAYIRQRSNHDVAFFRASGVAAPELFPGDSPSVLTLRYFMDDELHGNDWRIPKATWADK